MAGFSSVTGDESIMFADNASFDGTKRGGKMTLSGQLWIGDVAAPHVKLGNLTSPDGSITFGYLSPNITAVVTGGAPYYSLTPYIVGTDVHSQYPTIAAAVAQAIADGASSSNPKNIHIKPKGSDYTENVVIVDGINLIGQGDQTAISGKISMTAAGSASISDLTLKTNGDFCLEVSGSAASVVTIFNCNFYAVNNTAISMSSSSGSSLISIHSSFFFIQTTGIAMWSSSGAGFLSMAYCSSANTGLSTTPSNNSNGFVQIFYPVFDFPISSSATGTLTILGGSVQNAFLNVTPVTGNGSGGANLSHLVLSSGTASCVSIGIGAILNTSYLIASSSNANVLTGAGTMFYSFITFTGSSSGHNVSVETPYATLI